MSNAAPLRIKGLRLVGSTRDYEVDFSDASGPRSLGVIAGQIATGKTTVLDFIGWCLGAKSHPEHDEIVANVRTAQLAIEVLDSDSTGNLVPKYLDYVIDRPLGSASGKAWLYGGSIREMAEVPLRSLTSNAADPDSLSQWLLRACGMNGLHLKQAPTKAESKTSVLSFLDVRPLWYLSNRRMGNTNLALEGHPPMSIKLNQVVDIMFGVTDDEASARARRIDELAAEERDLRRSLETLRRFLDDADFRTLEEINQAKDELATDLALVTARRRLVDTRLKSESSFAEDLRAAYESAVSNVGELTSRLRDRDTLLRRLSPLRAQYADELRRLELLDESLTLFDSLTVTTCPACQSALSKRVELIGGECSLCHQVVAPVTSATGAQATEVPRVDLASERRSLTRRLNQLKDFSHDVSREALHLEGEVAHAQGVVRDRQAAIDSATREAVSPYLAERDELTSKYGEIVAGMRVLKQSERVMEQLEQMEREHRRARTHLSAEKDRRRSHAETSLPRDVVLSRLGVRMEGILRDFGFPKIDQVRIDRKLVPFVRGRRYDKVGSSGAMTLIALAWTLSIFEMAVEHGGGHPGFLLIDSPQQNLLPDHPLDDDDGELAGELVSSRENIATNVYNHIAEWLGRNPTAQILIVDNAPPLVAEDAVVARYSGNRSKPPYGLIDNEDGSE